MGPVRLNDELGLRNLEKYGILSILGKCSIIVRKHLQLILGRFSTGSIGATPVDFVRSALDVGAGRPDTARLLNFNPRLLDINHRNRIHVGLSRRRRFA